MPYTILTRDQHFQNPGPKRILALDGGGLRGMLTLGYLQRIEATLKERHGDDPGFRLCHYFDLIAGTSTGAIIAAALATGMSVDEVREHYQTMGREVFAKDRLRDGYIRALYDAKALIRNLQLVFGKDETLGGDSLRTGLLIVSKRLDSGSPWPLGNNPRGRYFNAGPGDKWISNSDYPLWKVIRASTAAPKYFDPETIMIATQQGKNPEEGTFVDGGVSPHNNPSLQAFMYATLAGYNVNWRTGPEQLLLVSVGTGAPDVKRTPSILAARGAVNALLSLMDDCGSLVETMMQWMSSSRAPSQIDGEIGNLDGDLLSGGALLSYARYNLSLSAGVVAPLHPGILAEQMKTLGEMDEPDNMGVLCQLGQASAARQIVADDFPCAFDLQLQGAP